LRGPYTPRRSLAGAPKARLTLTWRSAPHISSIARGAATETAQL